MTTWQPIETAPKDGTKILVCHIHYYSPITAWWSSYHPNAKGKETWREDGSNYKLNPTHWMPLPEAPKMEGND